MVPKGKAARAPAHSVARSLHEDVTNFALGQERKRESEGGRTDEVSEVLFLPTKLVDRSDMLKRLQPSYCNTMVGLSTSCCILST